MTAVNLVEKKESIVRLTTNLLFDKAVYPILILYNNSKTNLEEKKVYSNLDLPTNLTFFFGIFLFFFCKNVVLT